MEESTTMSVKEITSLDELDVLLSKRLKDEKIKSFEDFKTLLDNYNTEDMNKAVDLLFNCITQNKKIIGIHDSDTDGLGTSTLTYRFYKKYIPYNVTIVITDRKQGYGFLSSHVDQYPGDLYFTADNGITSMEATSYAKSKEKYVIINDHHQPEFINNEYKLPDADAIIDPYKPNDPFEFKDISGTVVYFIMLWKLLEKFGLKDRQKEWYDDCIDLLALTTLSDVMPLDISINRFLIKDFIDNYFQEDKFNDFTKYMEIFKLDVNDNPVASDFAFTLIPALNATQRMASPVHGFTTLIQEESNKAREWINYIFDLNNKRKSIQQDLLDYIEKYYKDWIKNKDFIIVPGQFKKEYDGVLGIIAGKLAEKYQRPAIVCNLNGENYKGSGRSVGDINILDIFRDIRKQHSDLFTHIGGHKQALGVGFHKDNLTLLFNELQEYMKNNFTEKDYKKKVYADFYVKFNQVNVWDVDLYKHLLKWEPFGQRFPKPVFKTQCFVSSYNLIGKQKNHMSINFTDKNNLIFMKGMYFFFDEDAKRILDRIDKNTRVNVIWQPELDSWKGNEKLSMKVFYIEEIKD